MPKRIPGKSGKSRMAMFTMAILCLQTGLAQLRKPLDSLQWLTTGTNTSIRAVSVVNDKLIWVSGSGGMVGNSGDAGLHWRWHLVPGAGNQDYRCLKAFNSRKAIIINAGDPAKILLTRDGGYRWEQVFASALPGIFFDGMTFWNAHQGIAVSDPVNGKFFLLVTRDGGEKWRPLPAAGLPVADSGEASFAASNTTLIHGPHRKLWLATGGVVSRVFCSQDGGKNWKAFPCKIIQGKPTTGIFSMAFYDQKQGIVVGGDYQSDRVRLDNALLTADGGRTWRKPRTNPYGYRSAVAYLTSRILIATGPTGTDISRDGGDSWKHLSDVGFNVAKSLGNHRTILLAGNHGSIARWVADSK
ncbi:MAG TPA: hypothetical protein VNE41_07395 [Chitinophagaceae bacterium]|nr:hypothetical protein [Chitinophagaceae bacterium]